MNQLTDQNQRQQALDPTQSFIVQAPAGSGKTSLLTQRFLTLLQSVNQPEEILAITFTRKAAAEMQERILRALQTAQHPQPDDAYEALNWQIAQKALQRDQQSGWNLLYNPSRLQIKTIDSFCASLTNHLPILAKFGAQPTINQEPTELYEQAVQSLLNDLNNNAPWRTYLETLFLHLDNNYQKVNALLIDMLAKRDHWLPLIIHHQKEQELRAQLEANLTRVNEIAVQNLETLLTHLGVKKEIFELLEFASTRLPFVTQLHTSSELPKNQWLMVVDLLLTQQNTWRKQVNARQGFPAPSSTKNKEEKALFESMKNRAKALLETLSTEEELLTRLIELRNAPACTYTEEQWQILYALLQLLPILCAKLRVVFSQQGEVDFTEMMLASLEALGEEDNPTDLALILDYQLRHILVDEFQDTSVSQLRLLEKLTAGWQSEANRTLFLVGDPMQSIYRFRNAEVSLFLRAKQEGLNQIPLTFLNLESNFRSQPALIDWFNQTFQQVFPQEEDMSYGAITYSASVATKQEQNGQAHLAFTLADREAEAQYVVELVSDSHQAKPSDQIAILVQARHHLALILQALKQAGLNYQGVDLAPLAEQPHIQDLLALTKALLYPGDRTAWLASLRAPWCGLSLADLLQVSNTQQQETIWQRLNSMDLQLTLSEEGYQRLQIMIQVFTTALATRYQKPLADLVKDTWKDLQAPSFLTQSEIDNDCAAFFAALSEFDRGGNLVDLSRFETHLEKLFANPDQQESVNLHIMTIHKAKGLEFDHVIIPSLDRGSQGADKQLLLWSELAREDSVDTLLAPVKASNESNKDSIYQYLEQREMQALAEEKKRLLYVAATRAKTNLFLLACQTERDNKNSFLHYLQQAWEIDTDATTPEALDESETQKFSRKLHRLPLTVIQQNSQIRSTIEGHNPIKPAELLWQPKQQTKSGSIIHQVLQQIGEDKLTDWTPARLTEEYPNWITQLKQAGIDGQEIESQLHFIQTAIQNVLTDSTGQWLFAASHQQAYSELPLSKQIKGKVKHFYIDRVILDQQGQLWLVDFKTTPFQTTSIEQKIEYEKKHYQDQLNQYKSLLTEYFGQMPRCGLYFTDLPRWVDICYTTS